MKKYTEQKRIADELGIFVIPFYGDQTRSIHYLSETIEGLFAQTDPNWKAIIVDDASPGDANNQYLLHLEQKYPQKITVMRQSENQGAGVCRNYAIKWAFEQEYPIILFNDADDISHPDRLKVVREIFLEHPTVDLVYSGFKVIDEKGQLVPRDHIALDIVEIIEANETEPVEGYNAWIKIGTVSGFSCLPSSTSVRTRIAYDCPFPDERRSSEDSHAWMHIAARGNEFKFTPLIPSLYRIPRDVEASSHRSRVGKKRFYEGTVETRTNGFLNAMEIALNKGAISSDQVEDLKVKFAKRLAETLIKANEAELAEKFLNEFLLEKQE